MINKILVADYYFLKKNKYDLNKLVSVFPMQNDKNSYRASLNNLKQRSILLSKFYSEIHPIFKKTSNQKIGYKNDESNIIFKQIVIKLSNIFIDHLIRVNHILNNNDIKYKVQYVDEIDLSSSHSIFPYFSSSWQLNQMMIMKISNIFGIDNISYISKTDFPELKSTLRTKNLIFAPYGSFLINLKRRLITVYIIISKILGRIINRNNKILSAGFSSDEFYFGKNGAYGPFGCMIRVRNIKPEIICKEKNILKRSEFKTSLFSVSKIYFQKLIKDLGLEIKDNKTDDFFKLWLNLIVDSIPIFLFENLNINIENYENFLKKNHFKKYLIGEPSTLIDNDSGILLSLSCKRAEGTLLGVQHSAGHFGYIDDLSYANFFEYSHYDSLFTFGWTKTNSYLPSTDFIPMPCPKISNKNLKNDYLDFLDSNDKKDILFLSNTISRFPMGGTCGHSRIDFINSIMETQERLIEDLCNNNLSVLHKPYNQNIATLFYEHHKKLKKFSNYFIEEINQKGLTVKLIKKCKILLWDQIGSGTVEALACEVPSMIFWKRIYSKEAEWAKVHISDLEDVGVVHSDIKALIKEIKIYLIDPIKWMNDTNRKNAIRNFTNNYANCNENWYKIWKNQIKSLV